LVLKQYGFGINFRNFFKVLYNENTSRIMVNGHFSEKINIERGVKQGDALSCAIFILCIDPLIRNLNNNKDIEGIPYTNIKSIFHKACAYADDISIICKENKESIRNIFKEYQRLTWMSGLELNADKTEILRLSSSDKCTYNFEYLNSRHTISNVEEIKICGIFFSFDVEKEKTLNVTNKIRKMECKLKPWIKRGLSLEGKILITKTFGLSQLIYNMQCCDFDDQSIIEIERKIFGFIWSNQNSELGKRAIDRIKRSILKNEYEKGGLNATDIDALDRSLKLRQYIRAGTINHPIRIIQQTCLDNALNPELMQQDFGRITNEEKIIERAQSSLNLITDFNRSKLNNIDITFCKNTIDQVSSIDVEQYLRRKKRVLATCVFKHISDEHFTFLDVVRSAETEQDKTKSRVFEMIINNFPNIFRQIALCFNDDLNEITNTIRLIQTESNNWVDVGKLTVKMLQKILKLALNKTTDINVNQKAGIVSFSNDNFLTFRSQCKNAKLRSIYYRMANNDFFSNERMQRFKMVPSNKCTRCNDVETTKHMLWECHESKKIWNFFNDELLDRNLNDETITNYSDLYNCKNNAAVTTVKMKIVQSMIQIVRPSGWTRKNVTEIIDGTKNIEKYNAVVYKTNITCEKKWKNF
jgi:hypothetical protein